MNITTSVTQSELTEVRLNTAPIRPVFIWGAPGIGRSAMDPFPESHECNATILSCSGGQETLMKALYINFYFRNINYDDNYYSGIFHAPDNDVVCEFKYNRNTKEIVIWNNNKPTDDILPIPIWWLDKKIDENGKLNKCESRVCY